ncbi:hypothetical protein D3C71_1659450 [compost metagenome]
MLRTQCRTVLGHIGNQPAETRSAKIAQATIGGTPVPAVVDRVDHKPRGIELPGKAVIALTMLGKPVGNLHRANGFASHVCPGVCRDLGAVCVGEEGRGG